MKLKELLKKLYPDHEKDIDDLEEEEPGKTGPAKPDPPKKDPGKDDSSTSEIRAIVDELKAENKKLLDELSGIKTKEEAREKLLEEKAKTDRTKQIKDVIQKAVEEKRIPAKNEDLIKKYEGLLDKDFESAKAILDTLPAIGAGSSQQGSGGDKGGTKGKARMLSPLSASTGDTAIMKAIQEQNEI